MSYQKWLGEVKDLYFTMFGGILEDSNPLWYDLFSEGRTPIIALEMAVKQAI